MAKLAPFLKPPKNPVPQPPDDVGESGELFVTKPPLAGFWRRLGAFILDMLLFYPLFRLAGWLLHDSLLSIGEWTPIIGAVIVFVYLILGNGPVGKGRTLGKMLVGLRVSDFDGNPIGIGRATARTVLLLPGPFFAYFISPWLLRDETWNSMIIGFSFSLFPMLALFLANSLAIGFNPFKQGLHDHLTKTLVRPVAAPQLPFEELCAIVGDTWRRYYKQAFINGSVTFLLILSVLMILSRQLYSSEGNRANYEFRQSFLREHFPKNTVVRGPRILPPDFDIYNMGEVTPEQVQSFTDDVYDETSTATLQVQMDLVRAGHWPEDREQVEEEIKEFAKAYHKSVIGSKYADFLVSPRSDEEGVETPAQNLTLRPMIFSITLHEAFSLFFFPSYSKRLETFVFPFEPLGDFEDDEIEETTSEVVQPE